MDVPEPAQVPDVEVLRGNLFEQSMTMPADDDEGNPIDWSGDAFTVASSQATFTVDADISGATPVVTLTLATTDPALPRYLHWYLADSTVFGAVFLTGRVKLRDRQ